MPTLRTLSAAALLLAGSALAASGGDAVISETLLQLPWGGDLPQDNVRRSAPAGGSFMVLPGPSSPALRPSLTVRATPGGLAATAVRGDNQRLAVVALAGAGAPVALDRAPIAAAARGDGGFWALYEGELVHHGADGRALASVTTGANALVGGAGDGAWLIRGGRALLVDGEGAEVGAWDWSGGPGSVVGADGALCALGGGTLACLSTRGSVERRKLDGVGAFETLLAVDGEAVVTREGTALRRHGPGAASLELQNAGLTAAGEAFVSGRDGDALFLQVAGQPARALPLPDGAPPSLQIVSVDGDEALAYGQDLAARYSGEALVETFKVDDARYDADVFPALWTLSPQTPAVATASGAPVIAASGPEGVVLIELAWP